MSSAKKLRRPSQRVPVRYRSTSSSGAAGTPCRFVPDPGVGLGELGMEVLAAQHGGLVLVAGVAQQGAQRALVLPEGAQAGEVAAVHEAEGQEAAVDAARAGARDDVDPGVGLQHVEQVRVGARPRVRCSPAPAGLHEEVQLVGHAAHPDREAHAPVEDDGEADVLRGGIPRRRLDGDRTRHGSPVSCAEEVAHASAVDTSRGRSVATGCRRPPRRCGPNHPPQVRRCARGWTHAAQQRFYLRELRSRPCRSGTSCGSSSSPGSSWPT